MAMCPSTAIVVVLLAELSENLVTEFSEVAWSSRAAVFWCWLFLASARSFPDRLYPWETERELHGCYRWPMLLYMRHYVHTVGLSLDLTSVEQRLHTLSYKTGFAGVVSTAKLHRTLG